MNKIIFFLTFIVATPFFGQKFSESFKSNIQQDAVPSGFLYDGIYTFARLDSSNKDANAVRMNQALMELSNINLNNSFKDYNDIKSIRKSLVVKNQLPLALILTEIQRLKKHLYTNGNIALNENEELVFNKSLNISDFDTFDVSLMGVMEKSHKGMSVSFILTDDLIFNYSAFQIQSIKAKFTGEKWQVLEINKPINISFDSPGLKHLAFEVELSNGETVHLTSSITIKSDRTAFNNRGNTQVEDITSTLTFQGYSESQAYEGKGEYQIFLDTQEGVLDKPIFLLDGFDPGDGRSIEDLYSILSYSGGNLIDDFRAQGYDVILLNFPVYARGTEIIDGGTDYIQRNAYVFIELINLINQQKVGTHPNIVIGPSMGGLISRYALRYMEMNSMTHDTGLWFSFDSPHRGANVPIGLQHLLNYVGYGQNNADVQEIVDALLRNPAAKQMLIDHADGHLASGSTYAFNPNITLPTGAPSYRNVFQNELNVIGYPQNTRRVSISNGSGVGQLTGTAGMKILDWTFYPDGPSGFTRALIETWFTPAAGSTSRVSRIRGQIWVLFWVTASTEEAFAQSASGVGGLDSAPGGYYDIADLASGGSGNPVFDDFLDNLLIDKFNFIPNLSSLGIASVNNWNASVTPAQATNFHAAFIPAVNEPHVTITPQNLAFILNEINALSSENFNISQEVLLTNPLNGITVHTFQNTIDNIQIFDILGRQVFQINDVNVNEKQINLNHLINQAVIVKVKLQNGVEKTFKTFVK